jgi:predicted amidohydrolase
MTARRKPRKRPHPPDDARQRWVVAAVQLTSTTDVERNCRVAERQVERAAASGADLVALPENFAFLRWEGSPQTLRVDLDGELVNRFRRLARRLGCFLLLGSIPERIPRSRRIHNTSLLVNRRGEIVAAYRKLHLFDVDIPGTVTLSESASVRAGVDPVVVRTELGTFGLSICYDLRFPELYRRLTFAGAEVLFVPAAFTAFTGPHHWLPLLRARAIENQCWVVAPAQVGVHNEQRRSHGETVVLDPWGRVVARRLRGAGFVSAEIDRARLHRIRAGLPCLRHTRIDLWRRALTGAKRRRVW